MGDGSDVRCAFSIEDSGIRRGSVYVDVLSRGWVPAGSAIRRGFVLKVFGGGGMARRACGRRFSELLRGRRVMQAGIRPGPVGFSGQSRAWVFAVIGISSRRRALPEGAGENQIVRRVCCRRFRELLGIRRVVHAGIQRVPVCSRVQCRFRVQSRFSAPSCACAPVVISIRVVNFPKGLGVSAIVRRRCARRRCGRRPQGIVGVYSLGRGGLVLVWLLVAIPALGMFRRLCLLHGVRIRCP